jgi:flagellar hook-basal body complex protein FliE
MSISGIESIGFTPYVAPTVAPAPATGAGGDFGSMVVDGIERLEGIQESADTLAVRAASGTLPNIHDYTLAATEADVATKLTVAVRNKAIESFTEIMRMHVG